MRIYVVLADGGDGSGVPSGTSSDIGSVEVLGLYEHYQDAVERVIFATEAAITAFGEEDCIEEMLLGDEITQMRDASLPWDDRYERAKDIFWQIVGGEMGAIKIFTMFTVPNSALDAAANE